MFCILAYVGLPLHRVSLGKEKRMQRASMSIVLMVVVAVVHDRLMACACVVCGLETYAK